MEARGNYMLVLDDDDILLQRALYYFFKTAKENPDKDWFVSDFLHVDQNLQYISDDYYGWNFKDSKEILATIFEGNHFIQGNVCFKKEIFMKVGGFDESMHMGEDIDLYVRFLLQGSMPMYVPFQSHLHRFHTSNLSKDITRANHNAFASSLKEKYKRSFDS